MSGNMPKTRLCKMALLANDAASTACAFTPISNLQCPRGRPVISYYTILTWIHFQGEPRKPSDTSAHSGDDAPAALTGKSIFIYQPNSRNHVRTVVSSPSYRNTTQLLSAPAARHPEEGLKKNHNAPRPSVSIPQSCARPIFIVIMILFDLLQWLN